MMRISFGLFLTIAFTTLVATATAQHSPAAIGTMASCDSDLFSLIPRCILHVMQPENPKEIPSQACCDTYQKVDVPCLCSKVDKGIEEIISMPKVVYVADYCKRPLTPGTKCGSEWSCATPFLQKSNDWVMDDVLRVEGELLHPGLSLRSVVLHLKMCGLG
ncbi:hypothetical protein HU200_025833 [Digitaria exilis]|uniref:Bifunctional inhibitor/plant lipid transfer protein/seed storage helical domain-containing protein n=1 Tax=Digitaria exilis TaxID=1010633 RepID=A0A835BVN0_9POAL|nr:hypothetical protein HU200_025833 [Digitaria exilis]